MSDLIIAPKNRTCDYSGSIFRSDGTTGVVLAADDKLRFKVGRGDESTPILDLLSGSGIGAPTPTANGSSITITSLGTGAADPATYTVRLAQGDLATVPPGSYVWDLILVDNSETTPADAAKPVESGVVQITSTLGGPVTL